MVRVLFVCLMALLATQSFAEMPERRVAISRNADFPGGDLQTIFDTTLDACQSACLATGQCRAFTFNQRANACFLKNGVTTVDPFEGAISARIYETDPAFLARAAAREADLSFLTPTDLIVAAELGRSIGRQHSVDEMSVETLESSAALRRAQNDFVAAMRFTGAALSITDAADQWVEYARLSGILNSADGNVVSAARANVIPAAIAGYLRADNDNLRVSALLVLATGLEESGRGRAMIPALQLAQSIQPRRDTDAALADAIAKYGFNVADTQVESDSTTPRICAVFNEPLVRAGIDYTPYVQLPDPSLVVSVNDGQLCIDGVQHGARYRVVLREGLPAASGQTLSRSIELNLYVRDRSPAVRFPSRAYVLPRMGDVAIPVETVNLKTVDLTLRRLSERNIVRTMQEGLLGTQLYQYNEDYLGSSIASTVWTGTADVGSELNRDVLTRLPMGDVLADAPAGVYVMSAQIPGVDPYENPAASQWFVLSDLGISTWLGTDGLTVMVRGLDDASATEGATVTLLSQGNAVLGTTRTDATGVARFDVGLTRGVGVDAPAVATVTLGDDMAFVSLKDAAFDLSDRGVEGREPAQAIDVFMTTDRGAYRAGETIHLTALARDSGAQALANVPLTAVLTRPDGVEYSRVTSTRDSAGGHVFALAVAGNAPRGTWGISVLADADAAPLAQQSVLVEDFLPERIDFTLALPDRIALGDTPMLTLDARYLFGPVAGDLAVEGEALLRPSTTLDGYDGYLFGSYDAPVEAQLTTLDGGRTDPDGRAQVAVNLPDMQASQPLELILTARVNEGSGRPVERQLTVPVMPNLPMIGIRPATEFPVIEGGMAEFDLIALAPDLSAAPMPVRWTINRVTTRYQWYALYGNWDWEPITTRERVATGDAMLDGTPVRVGAPVNWGQYEIVVERTGADYVAASTSFYAGWYAPASVNDTPDLLEASLDAKSYAIGDTATFRIVPRYAGTAVVTVMSDHLITMKTVAVTEGENLISLPVSDEWGAGAYVSASVIRPMDVAAGRNPARAIGLGYAAVDPGDKALSVSLTAPDTMQPRGPLSVTLQVDGVAPGEQAFVTLAAVDVGILNITGFQSPDPQSYYFGQRKLGVEMRDVYGRLIDGLTGAMGTVRSGGDALAQIGMQSPPPTEELVAFFQGPVAVDATGAATVTFDMPAFDGTVRLMAMAWTPTGVGQASQDVIVRDPVVVTASVPRFLAPGDQSRMLIEVVHADGPSGDMGLAVASDGLALAASALPARFTLGDGQKQTFSLPFAAVDPGTHTITVSLTTPDGRVLAKTVTVPVVVNDPPISRVSRFTLEPGQTFTLDNNAFAGLASGTGTASMSVGLLARLDAPGLLQVLDRYPYGCTEQITSQVMPLLYLDAVASAMGLANRDTIETRIAQSIQSVMANQAANGAFGLWRPESGDLWLDAYVTDFLSRARTTGHAVPDIAFANAIDNLRNSVNYAPDFDTGGEAIAYALMVLAREGAASVGDLRYFADEKASAFTTPTGAAQLGASLALYGDQGRADAMFARATDLLRGRQVESATSLWRSDFGSNRRDAAAVLALAVEAGSQAVDRDSLISELSQQPGEASTQEAAWTLLAANALVDDMRTAGITLNGVLPDGPVVAVRDAATAADPIQVANTGSQPTDITLTTIGVPTDIEPAGGVGYKIARDYFTTDGQQVDAASVAIGTRLVTVLTITPLGWQEGRLMVNDPLPAGFEIDNPNLLQGGDIAALSWLDPVQGNNAEFRSDRFLAAVDWQSDAAFRLAYIVRAVSPGQFHQPAASVEDMYRPQLRARTATSQVIVTE